MDNLNALEEKYLKVGQLFSENNFEEGRILLLEMLEEYPLYGRAHNRLAWLYHRLFTNYRKAEEHYLLGMKHSPEYPWTYVNYILLLNELNWHDALKSHAQKALNIKGVDRPFIYYELGRSYEKNYGFAEAWRNYRSAYREAVDEWDAHFYKRNMKRARAKMTLGWKLYFLS
jgi:tetratricopeptide (TPR) repeat protein